MRNVSGVSWTLDELAARANASRASLVRMFRQPEQSIVAALTFEMNADDRDEQCAREVGGDRRSAGLCAFGLLLNFRHKHQQMQLNRSRRRKLR
jgi:AraC-like DNA-binding protein